jgi:Aldo/keto reductases, related to diketogulonate reductase
MMLLHHPGAGDIDAYKAMEKYVAQGKIRSLGLSNWYVKELTDFLPKVSITPALVQNEIHPYYQEQDVVPFIQEKGSLSSAGILSEEEVILQNSSMTGRSARSQRHTECLRHR